MGLKRSYHKVRHGSNKLGYNVCVDPTIMTPIDSYAMTRYYRRIKYHHALVVNKKSMMNHTLASVFLMCAEKSGSGKRGRDKSLR